jgi:3-hydroxyisobutyrate dehydrogenase
MGLATHVAETSGIPLPLGRAAENIYAQVLKQHPELEKKDFSSVYLWLKEVSVKHANF